MRVHPILVLTMVAGCLTNSNAANPCSDSSQCPPERPWCDLNLGGCIGCSQDSQCSSLPGTPTCNTTTGACVGCLSADNCSGNTAVCDRDRFTCVECVSNTDCGGNTSLCDPASQECVECIENNDCSGETAICDPETQTCVGCAEDSDCPGTACKPDNTCGNTPVDTLGNCEACEADSECSGDRACIEMEFDSSTHGTFCLEEKVGDSCSPPFSTIDRDSIQGSSGPFCGPREDLTTCDGFLDFLSQDCTDDSDCGATGIEDGLCRESGDGLKCTYLCLGSDNCKSPAACSTENPSYCCTGPVGLGCTSM